MTHATITLHSRLHCIVEFAYDDAVKEAVKTLPGTSFDGKRWIVAIMHLPTLKSIFTKLTVEPEVVAAYHRLLERMLDDLRGHERDKGIKALLEKHAVGIAAMRAKDAQLELTLR